MWTQEQASRQAMEGVDMSHQIKQKLFKVQEVNEDLDLGTTRADAPDAQSTHSAQCASNLRKEMHCDLISCQCYALHMSFKYPSASALKMKAPLPPTVVNVQLHFIQVRQKKKIKVPEVTHD